MGSARTGGDPGDRCCDEVALASGIPRFLPDSPPARWNLPLRNRTMSGLSLGTVVVEASSTSGAKMQARLALDHGKRALLRRLRLEGTPPAFRSPPSRPLRRAVG